MSKITLKKLEIEHFKGIRSFTLSLDGNAVIEAENGIGKTTVYDSFLYLLFGKDSTGRKDFQLRPLDRFNDPVKGLVLKVAGVIDVDGVEIVLRKEHHEKIVKKQLRGYTTECWIDEVPKKISEYQEYIKELVDEERFKLLTDLTYFNEKLHWQDRRKILLAIAGEIPEPEGFDELIDQLGKYTLDEYKTVLNDRKKRHTKERDEINPRIDEILKGLDQPEADTDKCQEDRKSFKSKISACKNHRQEVLSKESERQNKINEVNLLEVEKNKREIDLAKPDPTKTTALQDERQKLYITITAAEDDTRAENQRLSEAKSGKESSEAQLKINQRTLDEIRTEYTEVDERKESTVCYACGQDLPESEVTKITEKKEKRLEDITEQGNALQESIEETQAIIEKYDKEIKLAEKNLTKAKAAEKKVRDIADKRIAAIDEEIAKPAETANPAEDETWQKLDEKIKALKADIGEPVTEQLTAIENNLSDLEADLEKVNQVLAQADRFAQLLDMIGAYTAAQSELISNAVNDKFKYVTFKLFNVLLNGTVEETCETLLDGKPYSDMSTGEGIFVGIDIINVLSDYYGISVPLFIDRAESMTLPIESQSQTILLRAAKGVKELKVVA
jgi:hypothetical protein